MRIAYLILAHNSPNHLSRLIRALDSTNAEFFIHIDRKTDISLFRFGTSARNVTFLTNRFDIYWGEFSIVQATINLIRKALSAISDCGYLCLLSGSDYPLQSPKYIERFFAENQGRQFINLVRMPCEMLGKPIDRLQQYRLQTPSKMQIIAAVVSRLNRLINDELKIITRDYQKVMKDLVPYGGSQWWSLTAEACRHILTFVDARPEVVKFFRNVYVPDESFFHTIVGNSEFAKHVGRNLTFTDWSGPKKPAMIDMHHLKAFMKTPRILADDPYGRGELLFARKFSDDSSELTDFIDAHLINGRTV